MKLHDDLRHPSGGEAIDRAAQDAIRLAHRAMARFPHVVSRNKFIAGGAAVSSALVALAGVAVTRRMRGGASAEQAVQGVTEDELSGLFTGDARRRGRSGEDDAGRDTTNGAGPDDVAEPGAADDATVAGGGADGGAAEHNGAARSAAREARRSG